jgi:hypothetical protein
MEGRPKEGRTAQTAEYRCCVVVAVVCVAFFIFILVAWYSETSGLTSPE